MVDQDAKEGDEIVETHFREIIGEDVTQSHFATHGVYVLAALGNFRICEQQAMPNNTVSWFLLPANLKRQQTVVKTGNN